MIRSFAVGALLVLSQSVFAQTVLINEVDADQVGTDAAEFVELYDGGTGGTSLDGLVIVFWNGSVDTSYQAFDLDGLSTNAAGYFVLCGDAANTPNCDLDVTPNTNLVQNGADAVALYTANATDFPNGTALTNANIIDAIAYDTNDGDDAELLATLTPGQPQVNEGGNGNSTADSNQRCSGGALVTSGYVQAPPTPGADNDCAPPPPPDFVINEVDADNPGTDAAEFVEIYDGGAGNSDLTGMVLVLYNGSSDTSYNAFDLDGLSTDANGYFVLCGDAANVANCDLDVAPDTNLIQNGADAVALYIGDDVAFPGGTPVTTTNIVDALVYDTNDGDDPGLLTLLNAGQPQVNEGGAGDQTGHSNQRCANGTGGQRNTDTYEQHPPTPGSNNVCPEPPVDSPLLINEVDSDQAGTDSAEFIELYDGGIGNSDLSGTVLVLYNGSNNASYQAFDLDGFATDSDGFFVLCANAATTANCDLDVAPDTNLVQNGADAVALHLGDAVAFPNGTPVTTTDLIDALVYDTNDADDPELLVLLNAGQPQVNEGGNGDQTGHSNQRCPDGDGGQRNTNTYQQWPPSPGAANFCGIPGPVEAEIYEIQGAGLASPFAGQQVITTSNVVTALAPNGFFMQTPESRTDGDVNTSDGIFVFTGGAPEYTLGGAVAVGDEVDVEGDVVEFFQFTEFTNGPTITFRNTGMPLPAAVQFDATVPSPDPAAPSCAIEFECYEGMLVEIANGTTTGPNQRFNPDPLAEVHITAASERAFREPGIQFPGLPGLPVWDGNPEVFELDPDKLGLPNQVIPGGSSFSATGVIGFEFGGYELWPTSLSVVENTLPQPVRDRARRETTVGSLNLFRLFDDVDDPPGMNVFGEQTDDTVVDSVEYQRRLNKAAAYIIEGMKLPDILAVQEVESLKVLEDLAAVIDDMEPWSNYRAFLVEGNDIGSIDVGFLVRKGRVLFPKVTQLGAEETYINPEDGSLDILHDRPPLLLRGWSRLMPIKVMVVHNRSLGGIETARVQEKRFQQAQSIATMVQDIQDRPWPVNLVVIGDFNAFEFTDGYVDAIGQIRGDVNPADNLVSGPDLVDPDLMNQLMSLPEDERYSFIFRGSAQTLDHALTSWPLDLRVRGLQFARGNADAAVDLINDETTYLRSSDHDGLVLYLFNGLMFHDWGRWHEWNK